MLVECSFDVGGLMKSVDVAGSITVRFCQIYIYTSIKMCWLKHLFRMHTFHSKMDVTKEATAFWRKIEAGISNPVPNHIKNAFL